MNLFFKVILKLVTKRPKMMTAGIFVVTVFFMFGVARLKFETSINYLMPKDNDIYKLGQRADIAFVNSESFIISSIEAVKPYNLFSKEIFSKINEMIQEIEEYKSFDVEKENRRIDLLLNLSGFTRDGVNSVLDKSVKTNGHASEKISDMEAELDQYLLEKPEKVKSRNKDISNILEKNDNSSDSLWDISNSIKRQFEQPLRKRQSYDSSHYKTISLFEIQNKFKESRDENALAELETILYSKKLNVTSDHLLTKNEFEVLLNAWEDIYLFKSMEIVHVFMNPITGNDLIGQNNQIKTIEFIPINSKGVREIPETSAAFDSYQKKIKVNPLNKNFLYSEDATGKIQALAMSVVLKNQESNIKFSEYFISILSKYNKSPLSVNSMGSIVLEKYMSDYMKGDIIKFLPFVLIMIILTFYLNFRSLIGVLLPMLTVVIAGIWTMGLMGFLGIRISLAVSVLPPILLALGTSYSIQMYNQFLIDNIDLNRPDRVEKLIKSMEHISSTVFFAAFTTIISFITLSSSQITSLKHFGIFAAIGAFFSMVVALILIPSGLILIRPRSRTYTSKPVNQVVLGVVSFISYLAQTHTKKVAILFLILNILGAWGITRIKTETAPFEGFKKNSQVRIADDRLNKLFSGTINLTLIIDSGKNNGVLEPDFLKWVDELRTWLNLPENKEKNSILSNYAYTDIIKRVNMAFHSDDIKYFSIPEDKKTLRQYNELLLGEDRDLDGRSDLLEQFVDKDYRRINLIIRTGSYKDRTLSTEGNKNILNIVNKHLENMENKNNYKWFFVGNAVNMQILSDYIVSGQTSNIFISLIMIILIVYYIFRKIKISILSMIPLIGGMTIVYGIMGFLDIPLDIPKVILASIAIGVGIDNTIHFLNTVNFQLNLGNSLHMALEQTYKEAGMAIVYTTLAIILGFIVLIFSNFIPIVSLGLLVAGVMLVTMIGSLLFLPAYIVLSNPKFTITKNSND
ncbi:MAG: MMPL family transporter [Spirochaetia bacterium]|nr:MMPL family transporter [Spirochaetia bacterium]